MDKGKALKLAKKYVRIKPMPSSLMAEFKRNGWDKLLDEVYELTATYILEHQDVPRGIMAHLKQILPSIAFYKVLVEKEGSTEKALEIYEKFCFIKIKKMAKMIPMLMKIPGLYKKVPALMEKMLDAIFGPKAGFEYVRKECNNGFAADMTKCPYVETCKKYDCPELARFFCQSDDYCYGNMHPKLVWGRTKTLGTGGDCCDFCFKFPKK